MIAPEDSHTTCSGTASELDGGADDAADAVLDDADGATVCANAPRCTSAVDVAAAAIANTTT